MEIRITGGKLKGRVLRSPDNAATHPMGAREKIALFNMLTGYLAGAKVLDAYAGSGALGIEALSRGATEVVWVEKNPQVAAVIRKNLQALNLAEQGSVVVKNVENCCHDNNFDIIFADPPYDAFQPEVVAKLGELLAEEGILALSHPGEAPELPGLKLQKTHAYARARISLYRRA